MAQLKNNKNGSAHYFKKMIKFVKLNSTALIKMLCKVTKVAKQRAKLTQIFSSARRYVNSKTVSV